jgi:hypothetical protein
MYPIKYIVVPSVEMQQQKKKFLQDTLCQKDKKENLKIENV